MSEFLMKEIDWLPRTDWLLSQNLEIIYSDNNNLYVWKNDGHGKNEFLVYNVAQNRFKSLISEEYTKLLELNDDIVALTYNRELDVIVILGLFSSHGNRVEQFESSHNIHTIDLKTKIITKHKISGELEPNAYSNNIFFHDNFYYVVEVGGVYDGIYCRVYRLNNNNKQWETFYEHREERPSRSVAVVDGDIIFHDKMIYCFSYNVLLEAVGGVISSILRFNIEEKLWELIDTIGDDIHGYPQQRYVCRFKLMKYFEDYNNDTFAILTCGGDNSRDFNDLWKLNLRTMKWSCVSKNLLPNSISGHSMYVTSEGRIFIYDGSFRTKSNDFNPNFKLYSTWLKVPRLTDICWEAALKYCPSLPFKSKDEITSLGIPWKFFQSRIS